VLLGRVVYYCTTNAYSEVVKIKHEYSSDNDKTTVVVKLLLDKGADMHATSNDGETTLYIACSNGLVSVVVMMLECMVTVVRNWH